MKSKMTASAGLGLALVLSANAVYGEKGTDKKKAMAMMEQATDQMTMEGSAKPEARTNGTLAAKVGLRHLKFLTVTVGPDGKRQFSHQAIEKPLPNPATSISAPEEQ